MASAPKEGTYLFDEPPASEKASSSDDKISGKAWGRVGKVLKNKDSYPFGVFYILGNEFCERFSYYGMRAILVIYLTDWLGFTGHTATAVFHTFVMLCYFTPIFGAMLADGYIGKYKTILYLSILYCVGNVVMAGTAFPPPYWVGPVIGLLLIGCGTGGIKPCVSAFGGDQFSSDQEKELNQFFSVFYFIINMGSFLSTLITPLLRSVHCIGDSCFPLAFGVPAVLMIVSLVIFVCGRKSYKIYPPTGNVIGQTFMCMGRAIKNRVKGGMGDRAHWLYYADDKYEANFIEDVRVVLKVLTLFLPLPVFWALFDQQGSKWTLQAVLMDGTIGGWHILPDQMQTLNSVLILLLIPFFETIVYPICAKCNIFQKPLQRMVVGMLFAALAFVMAGFLQIHLDQSSELGPPAGMSDLRFVNSAPCPVKFESPMFTNSMPVMEVSEPVEVSSSSYEATISIDVSGGACQAIQGTAQPVQLTLDLKSLHGYNVIAYVQDGKLQAQIFSYESGKPEGGGGMVNIIYVTDMITQDSNVTLIGEDEDSFYPFNVTSFSETRFKEITPGKYQLQLPSDQGGMLERPLTIRSGGVYSIILQPSVTDPQAITQQPTINIEPNSVSIMWQTPQYFIMTAGEVMFSISGLTFAYSQAPTSMKAVLQAGWLLTVAMGNLLDVIIAGGNWLSSQVAEFFLFAVLMGVTMVIFGIMAYFYQYVKHERDGYEMADGDQNTLVPGIVEEQPEQPPPSEPAATGKPDDDNSPM